MSVHAPDHLQTVAQARSVRSAQPKGAMVTRLEETDTARKLYRLRDTGKLCERCGARFYGRAVYYKRFCGRLCAAAYRADKRRKPRKPCPVCGTVVAHWHQSTCSKVCGYKWKKLQTRPPRKCRTCGDEYFNKGQIRLTYCSLRCYNKKRRDEGFETFVCAMCGKDRTRRKVRTRPRPVKFCSRSCRQKYFVGERAAMWRGGSDPNRGSAWLKIASAIRKRDGYVCQRCNRTQAENGRALDVDHIKPWRTFASADEANVVTNLISLCKYCHRFKTAKIEREWLKGDVLAMKQYEIAVKLPPLLAIV